MNAQDDAQVAAPDSLARTDIDIRTPLGVAASRGWIPELDGLRALVALAVVIAHFDPFPLVAGKLR